MQGHVLKTKILVKPDPIEDKTAKGVILPESYLEPPLRGDVIIAGDGITDIKVGDKVQYAEHAGTTINLEEKDLSLNGEYVLLDGQNVLFWTRK